MANRNQLFRYLMIDEMLRNRQNPYPSKQFILEAIQERTDKDYSSSSLEKDIFAMRTYFNAPIEFHNGKRGYFYGQKEKLPESGAMVYEEDKTYRFLALNLSKQDLIALNLAESVLEGFRETGIFNEFADAVDKVLDGVEISKQLGSDLKKTGRFIQMDTPKYVKGRELLSDLARAIREKKQVSFSYKKFGKSPESKKKRYLHPYLLKEYNGRWYVVGFSEERRSVVTFGLDRMYNLVILSEEAILPEHVGFDAQNHYKNCLGVTRMIDEKPELIVLSFDPLQGNYVKTRPLHATQKQLVSNEEEYRISLELLINPELIMEILSFGTGVKVLQPARLVEAMKDILQTTLEKYK